MSSSTSSQASTEVGSVSIITSILTVLGSITGVFIAMAWYFGRRYASGYFSSMNIESFQVTFSLYEYLEQGWLPIIIWLFLPAIFNVFMNFLRGILSRMKLINKSINISISLLIFNLFVYFCILIMGFRINFLTCLIYVILIHWAHSLWGDISESLEKIRYEGSSIAKEFDFTFIVPIAAYVLCMLLVVGRISSGFGAVVGRSAVASRSLEIQLVTSEPIMLGVPPTVVTNGANTIYLYEDFRLLTYNDQRYFLYNKIDSECKPSQVFIIKDDLVRAAQVSNASSLMPDCDPFLTRSTQITSTPTLTPTLQFTPTLQLTPTP